MVCKILIMTGLFIEINHNLKLSDDHQMGAFILMGLAIAFDLVHDFLKKEK